MAVDGHPTAMTDHLCNPTDHLTRDSIAASVVGGGVGVEKNVDGVVAMKLLAMWNHLDQLLLSFGFPPSTARKR